MRIVLTALLLCWADEALLDEVGKKSSGAEAAKIRSIAYHNLEMAKQLLKHRTGATGR